MPEIIRRQRGAAAIEFAIVLPLLIVLVFGIIEFSICLYDKAVITNASREGARAGIVYAGPDLVRPDATGIATAVNNYVQNHLITFGDPTTSPTVQISCEGVCSTGDPLTVTVGYHYEFLVLPNFVNALVGGVDIAAETVMRLE